MLLATCLSRRISIANPIVSQRAHQDYMQRNMLWQAPEKTKDQSASWTASKEVETGFVIDMTHGDCFKSKQQLRRSGLVLNFDG